MLERPNSSLHIWFLYNLSESKLHWLCPLLFFYLKNIQHRPHLSKSFESWGTKRHVLIMAWSGLPVLTHKLLEAQLRLMGLKLGYRFRASNVILENHFLQRFWSSLRTMWDFLVTSSSSRHDSHHITIRTKSKYHFYCFRNESLAKSQKGNHTFDKEFSSTELHRKRC